LGILIIVAIGAFGLVGLLAQSRRLRTAGLAEQRQALFQRLSRDPQFARLAEDNEDRPDGFTMGQTTDTSSFVAEGAEVLEHLQGLVQRNVRVVVRTGVQERYGRFVQLDDNERLVFRLEDSAAPFEDLDASVTARFDYRTLQYGWTFPAVLKALDERRGWTLSPPRTITRQDSRAHRRLNVRGGSLSLLFAGAESDAPVKLADLTEHGVGVEYQPGQLQFQVGDQHRAVLQVYGERFADPVVSVRDVIDVSTGVIRAGLQVEPTDADGRSALRQVCQAVRRAKMISPQ
jgi:hypothetical protein